MPIGDGPPVDWVVSAGVVDYQAALALMEQRVEAINRREAAECVWLLQHPPLYTAGTSARDADLLRHDLPVHRVGRGGQYTYHGPGQRIGYVMLDLKRRQPDVRAFVCALEAWMIATLAEVGVIGERRESRVGVWVRRKILPGQADREDKIAALGIRLRHWVSFHGIAINLDPDLAGFGGIVPCGIADERFGVTSFADLGIAIEPSTVDGALRTQFERLFGPTTDVHSIGVADSSTHNAARDTARAGAG